MLFLEKQCGNLTAPANGSVELHGIHIYVDMVSGEYGDVATFRCHNCHEFEQNGPSTMELFCGSDGKWNGTEPTCQGIINYKSLAPKRLSYSIYASICQCKTKEIAGGHKKLIVKSELYLLDHY